jgi:hypothetical protein
MASEEEYAELLSKVEKLQAMVAPSGEAVPGGDGSASGPKPIPQCWVPPIKVTVTVDVSGTWADPTGDPKRRMADLDKP